MPDGNHSATGGEQFTKFWNDIMGRMAAGGTGASGGMPEMNEQMRKTFFAGLAEHAEEFMRSEQFLNAMKHGLDNALALKQQVNQFLIKSLQTVQMPSRSDTDHIVLLVRGMEDRVMGKLDELSARIERLESPNGTQPGKSQTRHQAKPQPRPRKKR